MSNKTTARWANTRSRNGSASRTRRNKFMEILLGIALKTILTYVDHISPAVIDDAFCCRG